MHIDGTLGEALADARDVLREFYPHDLDAEIVWEEPAFIVGGESRDDDARLSHAIGFIHGAALAHGMTPRELLDYVPERTTRRLNVPAFRSHTYSVLRLVEALPRHIARSSR